MMTVADPALAQTQDKAIAEAEKICWLEVKRYPYQPDHQVELMHLQAEADALLIKLQAQKSQAEQEKMHAVTQ
ncbi:MAG: hypothetical protein AAF703_00285 [Cyanobacteria bacterium P01_D01_bin.105]